MISINKLSENIEVKRQNIEAGSLFDNALSKIIFCIKIDLVLNLKKVRTAINFYDKKYNLGELFYNDEIETVIGFGDFFIAPYLSGRILKRINGRLELALKIDDETNIESIRDNWYKVLELKQLLREIQGSDPQDLYLQTIEQTVEMKRAGMSYQEIATKLNHHFLLDLCKCVLIQQGPPTQGLSYETHKFMGKAYEMIPSNFLEIFMIKPRDAKNWVSASLEDIRKGHLPWKPEQGPIDALRVRDTLRLWEKKKQKSKIVVTELLEFDERIDDFDDDVISFFEGLEKIG